MQYNEIAIGDRDLQFLEDLTEKTGIEWDEVDFNYVPECDSIADVTNKIIYNLFIEYITNLEFLTDMQQESLIEKIYTNCLDSWIDDLDGFIEEEKLKKYRKELEKIN